MSLFGRGWRLAAGMALVVAFLGAAAPANAQGSGLIKIDPIPGPSPLTPVKPPPAIGPAPATVGGPPPYDAELLRLSEILGALQYLRQLCGSDEGTLWREQMQGLIDAENPDAERKARFVDRFNRGYDSFQAIYRSCTDAATTVVDRYLDEGSKIAADVVARYGREK